MYIPRSYVETDLPTLHHLMRQHNFATFISTVNGEPFATHLPFMVDETRGEFGYGTLIAHMARANPHWKALDETVSTLTIFQGAHTYVSPAWYENQTTVPTWNYAVVHAYGKPRLIHDVAALRPMVEQLVAFHENLWDIANAEPVMATELQAIVGFEIPIERLEGKYKFNQNRTVADQQGVISAMEAKDTPNAREVAAIMRGNLEKKG